MFIESLEVRYCQIREYLRAESGATIFYTPSCLWVKISDSLPCLAEQKRHLNYRDIESWV